MHLPIQIKDLFDPKAIGYIGDCFYISKEPNSGTLLNFIKGDLEWVPKDFKHPLYKRGVQQTGTYVIHELFSNSVYIGSSGKIYFRVMRHKELMNMKMHQNKKFQELIINDGPKSYQVTVFFTRDREEAYNLEQFLLDNFKNGIYGNFSVLSTADDVRLAMRGKKLSTEHKQRLLEVITGRKASGETREKMSQYRKTTPEAKAQFQKLIDDRKRAISVNGVEYISLAHAARGTGLPEIQIRRRVNRGDPDIFWVGENVSPLKGRKLTPEQIQKYKDSPYNAERTRKLLEQNATRRKPVCVNGVHYVSSSEACRQLMGKISGKVLHHHLKTDLTVIDGVRHVIIPITR